MRRPRAEIGRNKVAIRLAQLIRLLVGLDRLPNPADLARELDVHPRTVRRYLAALEEAQVIRPRERHYDGSLELDEALDARYASPARLGVVR